MVVNRILGAFTANVRFTPFVLRYAASANKTRQNNGYFYSVERSSQIGKESSKFTKPFLCTNILGTVYLV
jgi:hypothetical protein